MVSHEVGTLGSQTRERRNTCKRGFLANVATWGHRIKYLHESSA